MDPDSRELAVVAAPDNPAPVLPAELEDRRAVASDPSQPTLARLEAFEDILESEVGDTALLRARNLERAYGLRQIYLKFEGANPTGTQKDRIAFAQVLDALRRGFDAVTVASCGNYGAAIAFAASVAGLRCHIFIPDGYHTTRLRELKELGAEVVLSPGDYEAVVVASRELAERREIYDANPGGANTSIQLRAYGEIAYEAYDELRDAPAAVAVSVSNGTTLAGIHRGFVSLFRRGRISRYPRMVAGSSPHKNPIVRAFLHKSERCDDLEPVRIRENAVNEPLINWHSFDGEQALEAIRQTNGWAAHASDRSMRVLARLLREKEGISVLPASTAGLHALLSYHQLNPLPSDRYLAVLTARKS
ncbi:MAG: pyridoxal-phosphate dependent enzyme [bacterium]